VKKSHIRFGGETTNDTKDTKDTRSQAPSAWFVTIGELARQRLEFLHAVADNLIQPSSV
jgi:hypothetical protein